MRPVKSDLVPPGEAIAREQLVVQRAVDIATYLNARHHPYAELVECRAIRNGITGDHAADVLVVDVEVELPSHPALPILQFERFAVFADVPGKAGPMVISLRSDFPEAVHMNPRHPQFGRSLCLTEIPWEHQRLSWTAHAFIKDLRGWLARTARGENHQPDQELEPPFLAEQFHLVLPSDFLDQPIDKATPLKLYAISPPVWAITSEVPPGHKERENVVCLQLPEVVQVHGVMDSVPTNLSELHGMLMVRGVNLAALLREQILAWNEPAWYGRQLLLVLPFRLKRNEAAEPDPPKVWAVLCEQGIGKIGEALNIWAWDEGSKRYGALVGIAGNTAPTVGITVCSTHLRLSASKAAGYSGKTEDHIPITAIGAGALGSQVITLLVRAGYGTWHIVDKDLLMPHNLARHALFDAAVGIPKSAALAATLSITGRFGHPPYFVEDLQLQPSPQLTAALASSEVILDLSASVPVARALADEQRSHARRISFFMDPTGASSMLLCEGVDRSVPIDVLEMQLYNKVRSDPRLLPLMTAQPQQVPYAGSCRDRTFQIPNERVSLHAAVGAGTIPTVLADSAPVIRAWLIDPATMSTEHFDLPVSNVHLHTINGWRLSVDETVLSSMRELRSDRLQNETGGVLIGAVDTYHRKIYVVDMIPSPPDSVERRSSYIRGVVGLRQEVEAISHTTDGRLGYIGEWHSHPDGYSTLPSELDGHVFQWLADERAVDSLPPVMAILGERDARWFIDTLAEPAVMHIAIAEHV